MTVAQEVEPYRLDAKFERAVVYHACRSPRFWALVGREVDPEALAAEPAKQAMRACKQIGLQNGEGPASPVLVIQRLASWCEDGKIPRAVVEAVDGYLEEAELDPNLPVEEDVAREIAPVLKDRVQQVAVQEAIHQAGKRGDFNSVRTLLDRADRIGITEISLGSALSTDAAHKAVAALQKSRRLSTGVESLDQTLDGGLPAQSLGVWLGGPGDCKSMTLSHMAAHLVAKGRNVCLATLELPEHMVQARVYANLTGIPINEIFEPGGWSRVKQALQTRHPGCGECFIKYFTPEATTVSDLDEWQKFCEDFLGRPISMFLADYGDLLSPGHGHEDAPQHEKDKRVYTGLRKMAVAHDNGVWTASQSRGREERQKVKGKRPLLDIQHLAGGMAKARVADLLVSLNLDDETHEMSFFVCKHRNGTARQVVGPLPTDLSVGAVAPIIQ